MNCLVGQPRLWLIRIGLAAACALAVGEVRSASSELTDSGYSEVRLFGTAYVDARDLAGRFGLAAEWITPGRKLRLRSARTSIEFAADSIELRSNGLKLFLAEPVVARRGQLYLAAVDVENTLWPILAPNFKGPVPRLKVIAIDAGHGGRDTGNQNPPLKLSEKIFTLDVAKRLERLLKRKGYRVIMTRTRDRAVELEQRTALAARASADLFVSVHFNAATDARVAGTETFVMTPRGQRSSPEAESDKAMMTTSYPSNRHDLGSILLGYHLHREMVGTLQSVDRGLKHFRYSVLRTAESPAVLVEGAFLSNEAEGRKVATAAYRQRIAEGIASGIEAYATNLEKLRMEESEVRSPEKAPRSGG